MDQDGLFQRIKTELPRVPDEVIRDWLLPRATTSGWPPDSSWEPFLMGRGLNFWQDVNWKLIEMDLDDLNLSPFDKSEAGLMRAAYQNGARNQYSNITNGKERYQSIQSYVEQNNGLLPKPIIVLEKDSGYHSIVDGNHRYLVWSTHQNAGRVQLVWFGSVGQGL